MQHCALSQPKKGTDLRDGSRIWIGAHYNSDLDPGFRQGVRREGPPLSGTAAARAQYGVSAPRPSSYVSTNLAVAAATSFCRGE